MMHCLTKSLGLRGQKLITKACLDSREIFPTFWNSLYAADILFEAFYRLFFNMGRSWPHIDQELITNANKN